MNDYINKDDVYKIINRYVNMFVGDTRDCLLHMQQNILELPITDAVSKDKYEYEFQSKLEQKESEKTKKIFAILDRATSTRDLDVGDGIILTERWLPEPVYNAIKRQYKVED